MGEDSEGELQRTLAAANELLNKYVIIPSPEPTQTNGNDEHIADPEKMDVQRTERIRVYPKGHKGPYHVYIRAGRSVTLKHINVSKYLFGKYGKDKIGKITQMNNHKIRVEFSSANDANLLSLDDDPCLSPYRVYIPAEQVEIDGLIRLDVDEPIVDLVASGHGKFNSSALSDVPVLEAFRFEHVTRDDQGVAMGKSPTSVVRVTFSGQVLPERLVIDGLLLPVQVYKRKVMFCENCLRTGHTDKYCVIKSKCAKCGGEHVTKSCSAEAPEQKCHICGTQHDHADRQRCPKIVQANVKRAKTIRRKLNESYAEALKGSLSSPNIYDSLSSEDDEDSDAAGPTQSVIFSAPGKKRKLSTKPDKPVRPRLEAKVKAVQLELPGPSGVSPTATRSSRGGDSSVPFSKARGVRSTAIRSSPTSQSVRF